jgi:hypothetical protein
MASVRKNFVVMLDSRGAYYRAKGASLTASAAVDAHLLIYDEDVFHRGLTAFGSATIVT